MVTGHVMGRVYGCSSGKYLNSTGRRQGSVLREEWFLQSYIDNCKEHTKAEFNNLEILDGVIFESKVYLEEFRNGAIRTKSGF